MENTSMFNKNKKLTFVLSLLIHKNFVSYFLLYNKTIFLCNVINFNVF